MAWGHVLSTPVRLFRARRYKDGGPAAVANFEAGVEGFTTRAFRGCGIVTSEPFEVSDGTLAFKTPSVYSEAHRC